MSITAVSFGRDLDAVAKSGDMQYNRQGRNISRSIYADKNNEDTFSSSKKTANHAKKRHLRPTVKAFIAGMLTPLTLMGGAKVNDAVNSPKSKITIPFDSKSSSISKVSDTYGVDPEIIAVYNGITDKTDMSKIKELDIPSEFDYLQKEIDEKEAKLHKKGLSDTKRMQLEEETLALKAKQKEQQLVAKTYTDGNYIYYLVNTPEESPEMVREYGKFGIPSETFKDLFDIKDGELKRFNDLNYVIRWDESKNGATPITYKDYTVSSINYGSLIKVYKSAVDQKDISLKSFYDE